MVNRVPVAGRGFAEAVTRREKEALACGGSGKRPPRDSGAG